MSIDRSALEQRMTELGHTETTLEQERQKAVVRVQELTAQLNAIAGSKAEVARLLAQLDGEEE